MQDPTSDPRGRIVEQLMKKWRDKAMERERQGTGMERVLNVATATTWLAAAEELGAALRDLPAREGQGNRSKPMPWAPVNRVEPMERDAIVMAANAVKAACILRIRRAITAAKEMGVMPLNAEECATVLEHSTLGELMPIPSPPMEPPS